MTIFYDINANKEKTIEFLIGSPTQFINLSKTYLEYDGSGYDYINSVEVYLGGVLIDKIDCYKEKLENGNKHFLNTQIFNYNSEIPICFIRGQCRIVLRTNLRNLKFVAHLENKSVDFLEEYRENLTKKEMVFKLEKGLLKLSEYAISFESFNL